MRIVWVALAAWCTAGCGDEPETVAEVGWQFDYRDWRDTSEPPSDLRDCSNQPPGLAGSEIPPYNQITRVHVVLKDPQGQVPGLDKDYDCALGSNGRRLPIRGLVRKTFNMVLEAKTAAGAVLYRHTEPVDLTSHVTKTYVLPTVTGEVHFFVKYNNSSACGASLSSVYYEAFPYEDGSPVATPSVVGTMEPACKSGLAKELFIRELPVTFAPEDTATWNDFQLALQGRDAADQPLYCRTNPRRVVKLGNNSTSEVENLQAAGCP